MQTQKFDYTRAFDRNIGWLTEEEQQKLRTSCVAIAGVGGAGGFQAQALARLGIGRFKIADPDTFELTNINRQIGASAATIGASKVKVIEDMIKGINPEAEIEVYNDGLTQENADAFFNSADLVIDGIDFFEVNAKLFLFEEGYRRKIYTLTACPLGFGASLLVFSPSGMKYSDYFDLRPEMSEKEKRASLTFGLTPTPLCLKYMNKKAIDMEGKRAASVVPGLMLVGALTGAEAVNILCGKQPVHICPRVFQIDLLTQKTSLKYFPQGMKSPLQRLKRYLLLKYLKV